MNSRTISIKAGWLISLRLATYVIISGIVIYWLRYPNLLSFPFFAYSLLTLMLPMLLIAQRWFDLRFLSKAIPLIQIVLEIVIEVGIIYTTGNISSAFSALFILTIISAALVTNLAGTLGVASLVSISYSFVVWFGLTIGGTPGSSTKALQTIFSSDDAAFYNIFLHILTFFLVAFISGYLVERLKSKDRELEDTSKALRQARLETDDILRHLNSGLFTIDRDGRIIYFNRAAEEILGYREEDIKGNDLRDIFSTRMPELVENLLEVLNSEKRSPRSEISITNPAGINIPLGISTSLLIDDDSAIRGVIAIFQDLTETKKLEEKIRAADKMAAVGELSAAIAHEIRNPLAAISGSVEVLREELKLANENQRLMDLIVRESSRLNNILSDFLLYARGRRSAFKKVELCRLVSDVIEVVKHHPSYHKGIDLKMKAEESFIYIFGDDDQIMQILINLAVNGCEAVGDKTGHIVIDIIPDDPGGIIIEVSDDGPGIDASIRTRIFDPFYSTKNYGTGLGLAIVQRLAGNLGAEISCYPGSPAGTVFRLQFNQMSGFPQKSESRPMTISSHS
nr:PAS domain S-box protein [candidate division Zixibacteria bacterium]